jgi:hypothetical protein
MNAEAWVATVAAIIAALSLVSNYFIYKRTIITGKRPVIVFEFDEASGWKVVNIGKGPALNLVISVRGKWTPWRHPVSVPSMREEGEFRLHWLARLQVCMIGATYTDLDGLEYTTIGQHNRHKIDEGHTLDSYLEHDKDYLVGSESMRHWNVEELTDQSLVCPPALPRDPAQ